MGMGFARTAAAAHAVDGWGMGFLLVFFPPVDEHRRRLNFNPCCQLRRYLLRVQLTISVFLLLLFAAILIFTISTLPPSATVPRRISGGPRRNLAEKMDLLPRAHALQGMGVLYRRGTDAMNDVVLAHVADSVPSHELRIFLRLFLRSNLASRSDLVIIFPARKSSSDEVILQENDNFLKILSQYGSSGNDSHSRASFDVAHFLKTRRKEKHRKDPIWGKRLKSNSSSVGATEPTRTSYGSIVSFEADELDPENTLSGFIDHVPISLRRWACYPILMGRVKRNYKHTILIDIKSILLVNDPMTQFRSHPSESVIIRYSTHNRNARKNNGSKSVYPGIIMGGSRGVRRLSNAMLMNIVRAAMQQRKKKNSVSESDILNELVENEFVCSNFNLITWNESIPESSSLSGSSYKNYSLIRWGNSNVEFGSLVKKHICSFHVDNFVYKDCGNKRVA